tara:strand:- start:247 stop:465 length:219 start_codon:yes stop_codon:yes gene_type:complete
MNYRLQTEKQRRSSEAIERRFAPSVNFEVAKLIRSETHKHRSAKSTNLRFRDNARINYMYLRTPASQFLRAA